MTDEKPSKKFGYQIDMSDENAWDDTLLIKAYDESLLLAKEAVAKKLAKATNKKTTVSSDKKDKLNATPGTSSNNEVKYEEGDYVRATYTDGIDYEARILKIIDDGKTCLLRYIGYENEEFVKTSELIPSWGKKVRKTQKKESQKEKAGKSHTLPDFTADNSFEGSSGSDDDFPEVSINHPTGKRNQFTSQTFNQYSMPVPPPPPMPPMLEDSEDAENLSAMLMSWYMSGYYTGLYQGQKMARKRPNYN